VLITGKHREGLAERFAFYPAWQGRLTKHKEKKIYWLHASSVGEVQAARALFAEIAARDPGAEFVVTTMTVHGKKVARRQLGEKVHCFLAPLDVPWIAERGVKNISPDVYICLETELWPVLINCLSKASVRVCMANGRISDRSYGKYLKLGSMLRTTLCQFEKLAVITESDRQRYISLGSKPEDIAVFGNVKYDLKLPTDLEAVQQDLGFLLATDDHQVFVAGSTHTGEEAEFLSFYTSILQKKNMLFILAPRHVERVPDIQKMLSDQDINYHLLSNLMGGKERRRGMLVLVDTMGDLAKIYGAANFIFCGGSLVDKGGHNLMEAAVWQKAVFYGPNIDDFRDAADLLESARAGYRIKNIKELDHHIRYFLDNPEEYEAACQRGGEVARSLQGCAQRQVKFILSDT